MQRCSFFLILSLALFFRVNGQQYHEQRSQVLAINVLSNALLGGIGGAINKKADEKWPTAFLRNFFKGAAGGVVKYTATYQTYSLGQPQNSVYANINRLQFFLGHSMVLNAAYNRKLFEQYACSFYGVEFRYRAHADQKFSARLSLTTLANAAAFGVMGYELNLYRSLETGLVYFDVHHDLLPGTGQAGFNCLAIEQNPGNFFNYSVLPHEITHTYQMYDYFSLAAWHDKLTRPVYSNKKFYQVLNKYFVMDYEVLFFSAAYLLQPTPTYYRNYYEFEAEHFRSRYDIPRPR
jgi:hypothetical protein